MTDLVEQPAKVMRIGSMIRQLLEEVKAAPLDEASRNRLKEIHRASIKELEAGLAPELVEELERLSLPFTEEGTPSESELRIAQAQLVGWLEGLFHGIQTAIYAQQMAARAQLEQMRQLPPGASVTRRDRSPPDDPDAGRHRDRGGMYLWSAAVSDRAASVTADRPPSALDVDDVRPSRSQSRTRRTTSSPSRPTRTRAAPGAAIRVRLSGSASETLVNSTVTGSCGLLRAAQRRALADVPARPGGPAGRCSRPCLRTGRPAAPSPAR